MKWKKTYLFPLFIFLLINPLVTSLVHAQSGVNRSVEVIVDATGKLIKAPSNSPSSAVWSYWADPVSNKILRAHPDGTGTQDVLVNLNTPYGLGFDSDTQSFIWTNSGNDGGDDSEDSDDDESGVVQKLKYGQSVASNLISSFVEPFTIEVNRNDRIFGGGFEEVDLLNYPLPKEAITLIANTVVCVTENAISSDTTQETLLTLNPDETIQGLALDVSTGYVYIGNAVGMMDRKVHLVSKAAGQLIFTDHVPPLPDSDDVGNPPPDPPPPDPQPCPIVGGGSNLVEPCNPVSPTPGG